MSHDHGHAPPAPAKVRRVVTAIVVPLVVATVIGLIVLWPRGATPTMATDTIQRIRGTVVSATDACAPGEAPTLGGPCGNATVDLDGQTVQATIPSGTSAPAVREGDKVVVVVTDDPADPSVKTYSVVDHDRTTPLIWLVALFCAVIIAFGRWRGLASLGGLAVSFFVLLVFILPAIQRGESPLWVAVVGSAVIMFVVLYLTHGVTVPTTVAILGTLGALVLTGLLGLAVTSLLHLNGSGSDESVILSNVLSGVDLRGLLLAGIIIGTLGVLDDVTVTQTAIVGEIAGADPTLSARRLYAAAIRVGRAHIGSAVNTIILAYAGASLPLLLLIVAAGTHTRDVLTTQQISAEIVRGVVGTIGLVAAVPLTTALAAWLTSLSHRAALDPAEQVADQA
ncbi:YibE/F family protein [Hamadaea sp.]|uniref:YibE/F family protein n=1 Tax=Hamadaea sp. TaxID=2024425 RepID=UPI0025BF981C|nr:YibE/F family protein [Hamadaea sp.]